MHKTRDTSSPALCASLNLCNPHLGQAGTWDRGVGGLLAVVVSLSLEGLERSVFRDESSVTVCEMYILYMLDNSQTKSSTDSTHIAPA